MDLSTAPVSIRTYSSLIMCNASVEFQIKIRKFSRRVRQHTEYLVISRCRGRLKMYKDLSYTCTAIVLLIKPFVLLIKLRIGYMREFK